MFVRWGFPARASHELGECTRTRFHFYSRVWVREMILSKQLKIEELHHQKMQTLIAVYEGKKPLILSGNRWIFAAYGISQLDWETCITPVNDTWTRLFLEEWLIIIIVTTSAAIIFYHSLIFLLIFFFTLWGRCYLQGSTDKASGSEFICSLR